MKQLIYPLALAAVTTLSACDTEINPHRDVSRCFDIGAETWCTLEADGNLEAIRKIANYRICVYKEKYKAEAEKAGCRMEYSAPMGTALEVNIVTLLRAQEGVTIGIGLAFEEKNKEKK